MTLGQDGGINGMTGLILLLGRIDERTEQTADDVKDIKQQLVQGDKRMDRHDRRSDDLQMAIAALKAAPATPPQSRLMLTLSAMTGVAPLKEWLFGALVILMALKGLVSPAEIKALVFAFWG